jgi:ABC-type phosphate transport system substrate-binding protein
MRLLKTISLLVLLVFTSSAALAGVAVIVNKANPVDELPADDVRNIFLGKKTTWSGGKTISFVVQEGTAAHRDFATVVMDKTVQQYDLYWKKAMFTGTGSAPKSFRSDDEVKAYVASRVNAIGYVDDGAVDHSVKKINVR